MMTALVSQQAARAQRPILTMVIAGSKAIGTILSRGRAGYEAFDPAERSLGVFPDIKGAHAAIMAEISS
jgi:hypothetical protein